VAEIKLFDPWLPLVVTLPGPPAPTSTVYVKELTAILLDNKPPAPPPPPKSYPPPPPPATIKYSIVDGIDGPAEDDC
jgi:hypothetical protein